MDSSETAWAEFSGAFPLINPPQAPTPLVLMVEDDSGHRQNVTTNAAYSGIVDLLQKVQTHMAFSSDFLDELYTVLNQCWRRSSDVRQAANDRHGGRVSRQDLEHLLRTLPPTYIIKDLTEEGERMVWGFGSADNELFVAQLLVDTLRNPAPAGLDAEKKLDELRLIFYVTIFHSMARCCTKFFFGPDIITPALGHGCADPGEYLEERLLCCFLHVWIPQGTARNEDLLWNISSVSLERYDVSKILDETQCRFLVESILHEVIWQIQFDDLQDRPPMNDLVRIRGQPEPEREGEDEVENALREMGLVPLGRICSRSFGG
ncbi:hypothetical protein FB45DRAFT_428639 [Roridomyces roridus]|uniref:Uncharacterized protein n=1 Tax=Roridomyces roridus TaxID=1738132 RepID=A0AAD7C7U1_9AGAR|nr:hypothetical protein FB45DRAFT_428639 [Roridomyces roridus]